MAVAILALFGAVSSGSQGPGVGNLAGTPGLEGSTTAAVPTPQLGANKPHERLAKRSERVGHVSRIPQEKPIRQKHAPQPDRSPTIHSKHPSTVTPTQTADSGPGAPMPDSGSTSSGSTSGTSSGTSADTSTTSDSTASSGGH